MVEKIDVINGVVYVYNSDMELVNSINVDTLSLDLSYLNDCKLFSLNISQPIKRTVKFSELQGIETNAIYEETLYENMTVKQKSDFDNLVDLINEII
jgi:hypothetical protein